MKLFAIYNEQLDILTLNNIPPTTEMVISDNYTITTKTYTNSSNEFIAVMNDGYISIFDKNEYKDLFGNTMPIVDKETYYIKEVQWN